MITGVRTFAARNSDISTTEKSKISSITDLSLLPRLKLKKLTSLSTCLLVKLTNLLMLTMLPFSDKILSNHLMLPTTYIPSVMLLSWLVKTWLSWTMSLPSLMTTTKNKPNSTFDLWKRMSYSIFIYNKVLYILYMKYFLSN